MAKSSQANFIVMKFHRPRLSDSAARRASVNRQYKNTLWLMSVLLNQPEKAHAALHRAIAV